MKIAIDCIGTFLDPKYQPSLLVFMEDALTKGHEIRIWSSDPSIVSDAIKVINAAQIKGRERITHGRKIYKSSDVEKSEYIDLAIDDQHEESGLTLITKKCIHPKDIKDVSL